MKLIKILFLLFFFPVLARADITSTEILCKITRPSTNKYYIVFRWFGSTPEAVPCGANNYIYRIPNGTDPTACIDGSAPITFFDNPGVFSEMNGSFKIPPAANNFVVNHTLGDPLPKWSLKNAPAGSAYDTIGQVPECPSPTPTPTPTATPSFTPSNTPTLTPTPTETNTPEPTATFTNTPEPTSTNTPEPTATFTHTPEPTATFTHTPEPTATFTHTPEPTATFTHTPEPTPTFTNTPEPTATFTPIPNTPTPTATPVYDCNGTPNGTAVFDPCGVCGGDGSTCRNVCSPFNTEGTKAQLVNSIRRYALFSDRQQKLIAQCKRTSAKVLKVYRGRITTARNKTIANIRALPNNILVCSDMSTCSTLERQYVLIQYTADTKRILTYSKRSKNKCCVGKTCSSSIEKSAKKENAKILEFFKQIPEKSCR